MFTASDVTQSEDITIIDPEQPAETARLMLQNSLLAHAIGGSFPGQTLPSTDVKRILDLASGPGGWVLDVAFTHPQAQVIGIDSNFTNIHYARAQARTRKRKNAYFQIMDILEPLSFPDNYFDLVNARFLNTFLPSYTWPALLQECLRVVRPQGIIRLTECGYGISSSQACEKLSEYYIRALQTAGLRCTPVGRPLIMGSTLILEDLLYESGCQQIQQQTHMLDFSAEEEEVNSGMVDNALIFLSQLRPFLLEMGVVNKEWFECLYQQTCGEMRSPTFCGQWLLETAWGRKC